MRQRFSPLIFVHNSGKCKYKELYGNDTNIFYFRQSKETRTRFDRDVKLSLALELATENMLTMPYIGVVFSMI